MSERTDTTHLTADRRPDLAWAIQEARGCPAPASIQAPSPEECRHFDTGARRSRDADETRYDLISPIALEELARTYAEGAAKYGDFNWERGMPVHDLLNHALRHIYIFLGGDRSEPHLSHAMWGIGAAIHSEKMWPELNAGHLRGPDCTPPQEVP